MIILLSSKVHIPVEGLAEIPEGAVVVCDDSCHTVVDSDDGYDGGRYIFASRASTCACMHLMEL